MIKIILKSVLLFYIGIFLLSFSKQEITCIIKGKVTGRNSDTIILKKATEDVRFARIKIPIKDSLFEYKLVIPHIEAYELIFMDELKKGAWHPVLFFPEEGVIDFKLYPIDEFEKDQIIGGQLNSRHSEYQKLFKQTFMPKYQPLGDSSNALRKRNEYYSEEMISLQKELKNIKDNEARVKIYKKFDELRASGNDLSQEGKAINDKIDILTNETMQWRYKYIELNPSILSFYFLFEDLRKYKNYIDKNIITIDQIRMNYKKFSRMFPEHPYNQVVKDILISRETIKPGGIFIDFSAPDLNGNIYKLSEIIKGKVALIDLWASWCSPCIITSRSMIPVYEEFKNKGFTVCGVAAEIKNTSQMKKTIEREKFPWINLVELDHQNQIWYKYGISFAGGGTFLVDRGGKFLAINPTAEEVRNILAEKLK